jgi:hypothetical protein
MVFLGRYRAMREFSHNTVSNDLEPAGSITLIVDESKSAVIKSFTVVLLGHMVYLGGPVGCAIIGVSLPDLGALFTAVQSFGEEPLCMGAKGVVVPIIVGRAIIKVVALPINRYAVRAPVGEILSRYWTSSNGNKGIGCATLPSSLWS